MDACFVPRVRRIVSVELPLREGESGGKCEDEFRAGAYFIREVRDNMENRVGNRIARYISCVVRRGNFREIF